MIARRTLLRTGLGFVVCAPAIVRASSLMPVRAWKTGEIYIGDPVVDIEPPWPILMCWWEVEQVRFPANVAFCRETVLSL